MTMLIVNFLFATIVFAGNYEVKIEGMTCGGCSKVISNKLKNKSVFKNIKVDHRTGTAYFESDRLVTAKELDNILKEAGDYEVSEIIVKD